MSSVAAEDMSRRTVFCFNRKHAFCCNRGVVKLGTKKRPTTTGGNPPRPKTIESPLCVRCGACADTKEHRLWWCDANSTYLRRLLSAFPDLDVSLLPSCFRRCALVLLSCVPPYAKAGDDFLVQSNARATSALAEANVATCSSTITLADSDVVGTCLPTFAPSDGVT